MHLKLVSDSVSAARDALRAVYPVVHLIAGKDRFADYASLYRGAHPYDGSSDYGEEFPEYLDLMQSEDLPYIADLAQLEWLVHRARRAEAIPTVEAAALNAVPAERLRHARLELHPSCGTLRSGYPVARIWEIHQPGYAGELTVDAMHDLTWVLVNRPDTHVEVTNIDEGGYAFIEALAQGQTLGAAFDRARAVKPEFDPGEALQDVLARRLIASFSV